MSQTKEPPPPPPPPILRRRKNIVLDILARLRVKSLLRFRCICQAKKAGREHDHSSTSGKNCLPAEIVLDILTRLPVKSLLRFRCAFMSTHLSNSLSRNDHDYVIYIPKTIVVPYICMVASEPTFEKISQFQMPSNFQPGMVELVGSSNGLFCLTHPRNYKSLVNVVYLWNPNIRNYKTLRGTCLSQLHLITLIFAYHYQNNDYKVERISQPSSIHMPPPEAELYSLNSDSWKRVALGISWRSNVMHNKINCEISFPIVSGHLHWMRDMRQGGGQQEKFSQMILAFDVNNEKFREQPLPDNGSFSGHSVELIASFKGQLALFQFGRSQQLPYIIWVMQEHGVLESWNKLCVY